MTTDTRGQDTFGKHLTATRAVVITGASTGIGRACALELDRRGFRVFAGVRQAADATSLRESASTHLTPLLLDVRDEVAVRAAVQTVTREVGAAGLFGLVNNAGTLTWGPLEQLPVEAFRAEFEINVVGVVTVTQAFLSLLRAAHGRIVNIGSVSGRIALPFMGAYSASKFALEAVNDTLRAELQPWGITVSLIVAGSFTSRLRQTVFRRWEEERAQLSPDAQALYAVPFERMRRMLPSIETRAFPVECAAEAVAQALTSEQPLTRYVVGSGAQEMIALTALSDHERDALWERMFAIKG